MAQVNTVDIDGFLNQFEEGVVSEINKTIDSKVLDMHILMVTDIVNSNSLVLVNGSKTNIFEEKFGKKLENNKTLLEGVVSRKKQIVPFL